jgi:hypothetical protein
MSGGAKGSGELRGERNGAFEASATGKAIDSISPPRRRSTGMTTIEKFFAAHGTQPRRWVLQALLPPL